jgi:hypothetical protein
VDAEIIRLKVILRRIALGELVWPLIYGKTERLGPIIADGVESEFYFQTSHGAVAKCLREVSNSLTGSNHFFAK